MVVLITLDQLASVTRWTFTRGHRGPGYCQLSDTIFSDIINQPLVFDLYESLKYRQAHVLKTENKSVENIYFKGQEFVCFCLSEGSEHHIGPPLP